MKGRYRLLIFHHFNLNRHTSKLGSYSWQLIAANQRILFFLIFLKIFVIYLMMQWWMSSLLLTVQHTERIDDKINRVPLKLIGFNDSSSQFVTISSRFVIFWYLNWFGVVVSLLKRVTNGHFLNFFFLLNSFEWQKRHLCFWFEHKKILVFRWSGEKLQLLYICTWHIIDSCWHQIWIHFYRSIM